MQNQLSTTSELTEHLVTAADSFQLFFQCLKRLFKPPWRVKEICDHTWQMTLSSLPVIAVSTAFAGLVITDELAWHMDTALHSIQMVPGFTGQFLIRELGIAIAALLTVAKIGASMAAEVSSMKITEQIDALRLLQIDIVDYLVFPRWIACIFSLVILTIVSNVITILFAMLVAIQKFNFSILEYLNNIRHFVGPADLACALVKATVYGAVIPLISCAYGLRCKGGANGVGTSTTNSVVTATVSVIAWDLLLTYLFSLVL